GGAAVLLGKPKPQHAQLAHAPYHRARRFALALPCVGNGQHFALDEPPHLIAQQLVLFGQARGMGGVRLHVASPQRAIWPPSITKLWPVVHCASSEARYTAIGPMSLGWPKRRSGICFSPAAQTFSSCMYGAVRSVSIQPGQIALTRTLWRAHSMARLLVSCSMPPLVRQ